MGDREQFSPDLSYPGTKRDRAEADLRRLGVLLETRFDTYKLGQMWALQNWINEWNGYETFVDLAWIPAHLNNHFIRQWKHLSPEARKHIETKLLTRRLTS